MSCPGSLVALDDTSLWVVERGPSDGFPLIVLHGGPGLDHHEFGDYLDPLAASGIRLLLIDLRAQGESPTCPSSTWTLERMAQDLIMLARALHLTTYAVLGHSFGAFVALQNVIDYPDLAAATVLSCGVASARWFDDIDRALLSLEPPAYREQVQAAWAAEATVATAEEFDQLWRDQLPFHFADPTDPRIADYLERTAGAVYAPDVIRHFATSYGGIELEGRLDEVAHPVLVLAGRHDRTCPVGASDIIAAGIRGAKLRVFEHSAHMPFVEEPDLYLEAVAGFLAPFGR